MMLRAEHSSRIKHSLFLCVNKDSVANDLVKGYS